VGFFGFLNRSKGAETLLEATAELAANGAPIQVVFIGGRTGSSDNSNIAYAREVESAIEHLGISERVHWTGFTEPEAVSAALGAVDVVALPYREGASLRHGTLHAALAHGVAIITTTPNHPIPELRHREKVFLIAPGDVTALRQGIQEISSDGDLRGRLARGAADLARMFSWEGIARRTVDFYDACLERYTSGITRR
jgi:glycosyltransferase involved in cell wall biosynthesis